MIIRKAKQSDFDHLETFVWQAIFPAFDQPDLTAAQRAENDGMVESARGVVSAALERSDTAVYVAIDPRGRSLAGYLIADAAPGAYAEITTIVVKRSFQGKRVAEKLMLEATKFIGRDRAVSLAVRHYNGRAIAFFAKHDFLDTGETTGNHAIPRTLMLREAYEIVNPPAAKSTEPLKDEAWFNFPSADDEPVFEQLPDYRLAVDETPLYRTGSNALSTTVDEFTDPGESSLTDKQLSDMEAFIARARAKKGTSAPREEVLPFAKPKTALSPRPLLRPTAAAIESASKRSAEAISSAKGKQPSGRYNIPFEVDFGDGRIVTEDSPPSEAVNVPTTKPVKVAGPSFEFAFGETSGVAVGADAKQAVEPSDVARASVQATSGNQHSVLTAAFESGAEARTKHCPDCAAELPVIARFCYGCGYPQPEENEGAAGQQAPGEEFLQLEELPDESNSARFAAGDGNQPFATKENDGYPEDLASKKENFESVDPNDPGPKGSTRTSATISGNEEIKQEGNDALTSYSASDLRQLLREHLLATVIDYFGEQSSNRYLSRLETATSFQQIRDGSLDSLRRWLNGSRSAADATRRIDDTLADLTEYFIVETAGDLSNNVLPQRLLRHQSVDWNTVDLFKLVMDYLDFDRENERIYTDFVSMPERALRNASRSFLRAGKDERIFLICDQSLISRAKNGFAVTDSGLYWKTVLQPAGVVLFNSLKRIKLEKGHLRLDGQFFNAGGSLNLKLALLLRKLGRM